MRIGVVIFKQDVTKVSDMELVRITDSLIIRWVTCLRMDM